jgi:oxygen-independent coproporphyrinogen-3 oxidase
MMAAFIVLEQRASNESREIPNACRRRGTLGNRRDPQLEFERMSTTLSNEQVKAPPLEKQTTVGNYFVSNYPPFSFWKPELVGEVNAAMERPPKPGVPLGIYLHIPFCRKRCHFCYFKVYTDKDSAAIRGYIDAVLRELSIHAVKPYIGGRRPNFIYFGGGTPSYLSADQLGHLIGGMKCRPGGAACRRPRPTR